MVAAVAAKAHWKKKDSAVEESSFRLARKKLLLPIKGELPL